MASFSTLLPFLSPSRQSLRPAPHRAAATASLAELCSGQRAVIMGMQATGALGDHLLEMGMTRGTQILVRHRGGLGGGRVEIAIRSFVFSLPLEQARLVRVSALP